MKAQKKNEFLIPCVMVLARLWGSWWCNAEGAWEEGVVLVVSA
jgi:hypothetical protein